jgi:hypothetical protein
MTQGKLSGETLGMELTDVKTTLLLVIHARVTQFWIMRHEGKLAGSFWK